MKTTVINMLIFILLSLLLGCSQNETKDTHSKLKTNDSSKGNTKKTDVDTINHEKTDLILGRWKRPDGGYILDIQNFQAGSLEAEYYNPKSIFISETQWKIQEGYVYLFIKFDDEGYPGSYYSLGYHPDKDLLVGFYHQAIMQQNFDVYFERIK